MGSEDLNSSPHTCAASALPLGHLPQPTSKTPSLESNWSCAVCPLALLSGLATHAAELPRCGNFMNQFLMICAYVHRHCVGSVSLENLNGSFLKFIHENFPKVKKNREIMTTTLYDSLSEWDKNK